MYKLSHNLTDVSVEAQLKPNNERRTRGSQAFKFVFPGEKEDVLSSISLFPRTINEWNSLPEGIVNTTSVDLIIIINMLYCIGFISIFLISHCIIFIQIFTVGVISHDFY